MAQVCTTAIPIHTQQQEHTLKEKYQLSNHRIPIPQSISRGVGTFRVMHKPQG